MPSPFVEQQADRDPPDHVVEAALVVARLVGGDHEVQPPHARRAELAVDARLGRAAVEQRGGAVAVLDERGVALADVEEPHGQVAGRRRRAEPRRGDEREDGEHQHEDRHPERARGAPPGRGPLREAGTPRPPSDASRPAPEREQRHGEEHVGRGHGGGRVERQLEPAAGQIGAPLRELLEVGERDPGHRPEPVGRGAGRRERRRGHPERGLEHAEPHRGRHGGQGQKVFIPFGESECLLTFIRSTTISPFSPAFPLWILIPVGSFAPVTFIFHVNISFFVLKFITASAVEFIGGTYCFHPVLLLFFILCI